MVSLIDCSFIRQVLLHVSRLRPLLWFHRPPGITRGYGFAVVTPRSLARRQASCRPRKVLSGTSSRVRDSCREVTRLPYSASSELFMLSYMAELGFGFRQYSNSMVRDLHREFIQSQQESIGGRSGNSFVWAVTSTVQLSQWNVALPRWFGSFTCFSSCKLKSARSRGHGPPA